MDKTGVRESSEHQAIDGASSDMNSPGTPVLYDTLAGMENILATEAAA